MNSLWGFYFYCVPCLVALAYWGVRILAKKTWPDLEISDLAWMWFLNYSLANLYFVWIWDYAHEWRSGLLSIATLLVVGCSVGQLGCGLADQARGPNTWSGRLSLVALLFVNAPITVFVIWRKTQGLSLS